MDQPVYSVLTQRLAERIADMQARHQLHAAKVQQTMSLEHALVAARARALSQRGQEAWRNLLSQAQASKNHHELQSRCLLIQYEVRNLCRGPRV